MARKNNVPPEDENHNDGPSLFGDDRRPGDTHESEANAGDATFDPAELEAADPTPPSAAAGRDPFDPTFLGLSQDFAAKANVAKKWDIIKVEKPTKSRVFRVHSDPRFRLKTVLLTLKEDNETYLVLPQLRAALGGEVALRAAYPGRLRDEGRDAVPVADPHGRQRRQVEHLAPKRVANSGESADPLGTDAGQPRRRTLRRGVRPAAAGATARAGLA